MNIKASNLQKTYGDKKAVDGISLEIRKGQILGLLGPNGAGKSTTIKMLSGQIKPTSGTINIDGKDYSEVPESLRGSIGVMPQEVILWDELTIEENLLFTATLQEIPKDIAKERINFLIEGLNLQKELKTYAKNLSGGFRRRLNLAISILHEPSLIFLDEPTPGIDPQNRLFLWDFIRTLRDTGKYSIVLTDHYLDEAEKLSDYVVIVDEGKVIAEGTVPELKKKYGNGMLLQVEFDSPAESLIQKIKPDFEREFENPEFGETTISVLTNDATGTLQKGINILQKNKIKAENLSVKEPTLEDIFLILTGKEIRE